jgi:hypothetical protein
VTVEASSPALIEKARTVVTNGAGQYSIEDLRPAPYTVTFTLQGFTTVKREGHPALGSFVATVNGDLRVGGVAETITVQRRGAGHRRDEHEEPADHQRPDDRRHPDVAELLVVHRTRARDQRAAERLRRVQPRAVQRVSDHGGRRNEGQVLVDGMNGGYQGMGVSGYVPEVGQRAEVVFSLSGGLGEATTGGPQMNIVTKQGAIPLPAASS